MSQKYKESYDWKKLKRERALARADMRAKMRDTQKGVQRKGKQLELE